MDTWRPSTKRPVGDIIEATEAHFNQALRCVWFTCEKMSSLPSEVEEEAVEKKKILLSATWQYTIHIRITAPHNKHKYENWNTARVNIYPFICHLTVVNSWHRSSLKRSATMYQAQLSSVEKWTHMRNHLSVNRWHVCVPVVSSAVLGGPTIVSRQ